MHIDTDDGEELALNLAPMIDVVFLLLVFFMVATTFVEKEKEMGVDLPSASTGAEPAPAPTEIVINLLRDGTMKVAGRELSRDQLVAELERAARVDRETPVTIRGDKDVPYQRVVGVMDTCRATGLLNIGLMTLEG